MKAISARTPLAGSGEGSDWERIVGGVRYWFSATPYEVKAWRLRRDGGDLVHHWRDTPVVTGEYDPFDASTRPAPGEVAWQRHWMPNSTERMYVTTCRACGDVVGLTRDQLVERHGDRYGTRTCDASGSAATLKAAFVREAALTPAEQRASNAVFRWWNSCWGYDRITGEECHHPVCDERPRIRR